MRSRSPASGESGPQDRALRSTNRCFVGESRVLSMDSSRSFFEPVVLYRFLYFRAKFLSCGNGGERERIWSIRSSARRVSPLIQDSARERNGISSLRSSPADVCSVGLPWVTGPNWYIESLGKLPFPFFLFTNYRRCEMEKRAMASIGFRSHLHIYII